MAVYSVFEPPPRAGDNLVGAEHFVFVRDGFSWSAFIFGPFWMLFHRLFLALALWILLVIGSAALARLLSVSSGSELAVIVLLALLVGLEASTLRRWALQRRGWRDLGTVVGDELEAVERRFFDDWVIDAGRSSVPAARPRYRSPNAPDHHASDVIGLFPESGASR